MVTTLCKGKAEYYILVLHSSERTILVYLLKDHTTTITCTICENTVEVNGRTSSPLHKMELIPPVQIEINKGLHFITHMLSSLQWVLS